MTNNREELMQYIEMLNVLNENGFQCNKEINDALTKLHKMMLGVGNPKTKIIVFESTLEGFDKSVGLFRSVADEYANGLRMGLKEYHVSDDRIDVKVYRVEASDIKGLPNGLQGLRADFFINNTGNKNFDNAVKTK